MKVVHINFSADKGGAAIAAKRTHEAMKRAGINSSMVYWSLSNSNNSEIIRYNPSPAKVFCWKIINRLLRTVYHPFGSWSLNLWGCEVSKMPEVRNADVIYLHWVNFFTLSIKAIEKILKLGKPVYWFMHDMWPLTGGCHYAMECKKYTTECGACPLLNWPKGSKCHRDLSNRQFLIKATRLKPYDNLHLLAPSQWLANCALTSALFGTHSVQVSRNVIDTQIFNIRNKTEARKRLGLPSNKKLILFGADSLTSPYKGWTYLSKALNEPIENTHCVIYGHCPDNDLQLQLTVQLHNLGSIHDIDKLVDLYNAADILVSPSLADNYPNVIIEAMACGLPVVAFASCGITEMIQDGRTGFLVYEKHAGNLRTTIMRALSHAWIQNDIRSTVVLTNDYATIKKHHPHLFE